MLLLTEIIIPYIYGVGNVSFTALQSNLWGRKRFLLPVTHFMGSETSPSLRCKRSMESETLPSACYIFYGYILSEESSIPFYSRVTGITITGRRKPFRPIKYICSYIYTLWGQKRFLLPLTYLSTNLVYPFTLRVTV